MPPNDPEDLLSVTADLSPIGVFFEVERRTEHKFGGIMGFVGDKPVDHRPTQDTVLSELVRRGIVAVDDLFAELDELVTQIGIFHGKNFRRVTSTRRDRGHSPITKKEVPSGYAQVTRSRMCARARRTTFFAEASASWFWRTPTGFPARLRVGFAGVSASPA